MIFPMKITCFESLKWTNLELIEYAETEAEAWAKAWPQNTDKKITMEEFTKKFQMVGCMVISSF